MEKTYKRVPFDIELAKKIQSGEVEGRILTSKSSKPVRILCDDLVNTLHPEFRMICAILSNGSEYIVCFRLNGTTTNYFDEGNLVIELPEETLEVKLNDTIERLANNYNSEEAQDAFRQGIIFAVSVDAKYKYELGIYRNKESIPTKEEISKHEFKPFDKVLVRFDKEDDDDVWSVDIFSHYTGNGTLYRCMLGTYKKDCIIPYESNEHLVGTTNEPKED